MCVCVYVATSSVIPESVKWQIANDREAEALATVKRMAAWDDVKFEKPSEADIQVNELATH